MTTESIPQPIVDYFVSSNNGIAVRRIRTPHSHDVLCGRGGGINGHVGNKVFRDLVAERRLDYNLASTKAEKARVAKEVMDIVTSMSPPGRFLMRDPTGGIGSWWIEIDENRAMAKTSQALREGAPSIRAQHKDELNNNRRARCSKRSRSSQHGSGTNGSVITPLLSNAQFKQEYISKHDMLPKTVTPTFVPSTNTTDVPSLFLEPMASQSSSVTKSELVSNIVDWKITVDSLLGEFVNPFENEEEFTITCGGSTSSCQQCGLLVDYGKVCTCMSGFDPLHEILSL